MKEPFAPFRRSPASTADPPDQFEVTAPPPNAPDPSGGAAAATPFGRNPDDLYCYRDADALPLFYVARWDLPKGKQIRPLCWARDHRGNAFWRSMAYPDPRPLYGLAELAERPDAPVIVVEGEKCADLARSVFPKSVVVTWAGGCNAVGQTDWAPLAERRLIVLWPDNDDPGRNAMTEIAELLRKLRVEQIRVVDPAALAAEWSNSSPSRWDVADAVAHRGDREELRAAVGRHAHPYSSAVQPLLPNSAYPEPRPLPEGLLPVRPFDGALLPSSIESWVMDIAERMQCPPDYVAVPAMVALGSLIGRKVAIRPQERTDWTIIPNLWGVIVGRPGVMKTPAMQQALGPLMRLEARARDEHSAAMVSFAVEQDAHKVRKEHALAEAKKKLKAEGGDITAMLALEQLVEPQARRYIVNDATYEALGEILVDNPNGVVVIRDELIALIKPLDQEEHVSARGFYLEGWNGTGGYTFDRIIRGRKRIEAVCLSVLGSTQPDRLVEYMGRALRGGAGGDGLIQRFGMLVWPDVSSDWRNVDSYPNSHARQRAFEAYERLDRMDPEAFGAERDAFDPIPFLRFTDDARRLFEEWRHDLEREMRDESLDPAFEGHLSKYRKLVPALALTCHLAEGGTGPVVYDAVTKALAWMTYLRSHAERAYSAATCSEAATAKLILARIRACKLPEFFTCRDVHRPRWSGLTDNETVQKGLDLLVEYGWLVESTEATGGRPKTSYRLNPRARS